MDLIISLEITNIVLILSLLFLIKKNEILKRKKEKHKLKESISTGEAILNFLTELCNVPIKETASFENVLNKLNKGITRDSPYHGFTDIELNRLVEQGYVAFWDANKDEIECPNEKRSIIATPKSFELVEARKNNSISAKSAMIAFFVGMMAVGVSIINLLYNINNNVYFALFGGIIVILFLLIMIVKELQKYDF